MVTLKSVTQVKKAKGSREARQTVADAVRDEQRHVIWRSLHTYRLAFSEAREINEVIHQLLRRTIFGQPW